MVSVLGIRFPCSQLHTLVKLLFNKLANSCALKVEGVDNLFCAGEKSCLFVGHTEAICTGSLV